MGDYGLYESLGIIAGEAQKSVKITQKIKQEENT
jgi:hypothetical protein